MSEERYPNDEQHAVIMDLQARLAFQEDTLHQLNHVIARQDAQILTLQQQLKGVLARMKDLILAIEQQKTQPEDLPPPHY